MIGTNRRFEHSNPSVSFQYQQFPINTSIVGFSPNDLLVDKVIPTVINSNTSFSEKRPSSTCVAGSCDDEIPEASQEIVISSSVVINVHQPSLTKSSPISEFGDSDTISSQEVCVRATFILDVAVASNKDVCSMNLDLEVELGGNETDKEEKELFLCPSPLDVYAHKLFDVMPTGEVVGSFDKLVLLSEDLTETEKLCSENISLAFEEDKKRVDEPWREYDEGGEVNNSAGFSLCSDIRLTTELDCATGLQVTFDGKPKVNDVLSCTGRGNFVTSTPLKVEAEGYIWARSSLVVSSSWENPLPGEWHVSSKLVYKSFIDMFTDRVKEKQKKRWDEKNLEALAEAVKQLDEMDKGYVKAEEAHLKIACEDLQNIANLLCKQADTHDDKGQIIDIVERHDERLRAALDAKILESIIAAKVAKNPIQVDVKIVALHNEGKMKLWDLANSFALSYKHVKKNKFVVFKEINLNRGTALDFPMANINHAAIIVGELLKMELLVTPKKLCWYGDRELLLSVSDSIVKLLPLMSASGSHFLSRS